MSTLKPSRRALLVGSASAWFAAHYVDIVSAQNHVQAAGGDRGFAFFTPEQATEVEAMAAQIIPTDGTPGAREARVIQFIDRALVTFDSGNQSAYTDGLQELAAQTAKRFPGKAKFSALTGPQQIELLTAIEETPFFNVVRTHTITGFFASPANGGNQDKVGWDLVGYNDSLDHSPPFGHYDALPESQR
jgi:gluconate 2-dehydrogenase gamma chain